jgi:biotin carboxyl carrier protein
MTPGPPGEAATTAPAGAGRDEVTTPGGPQGRPWDPRAIRVSLGAETAVDGIRPIVVEPPETIAVAATGPAGAAGTATSEGGHRIALVAADKAASRFVLVDGVPVGADLRVLGPGRAALVTGSSPTTEHRVLLPAGKPGSSVGGVTRVEIVVDGWRFELDVELAARAVLRERASRGRAAATHSGPTEVRAIIPGVVAAVSVAAGDAVVAGQQLLVIEAMKMQNELRAPRGGTIERVSVAPGARIDVGDLLLVIG